jgi:hypothetical protein
MDMEGSGSGQQFEALSWHFSKQTEAAAAAAAAKKKKLLGKPVSWPKLESGTYRIGIRNITHSAVMFGLQPVNKLHQT